MVLTEVFKKCYLKSFISLRQGTLQNCQSIAGLCKDMALKWRSESSLCSTSSSKTAPWPYLKSNFAYSSARLYLSLPQDYKHQVQLMQGSEHQSIPKVWNTGTAGKYNRSRVSSMTDLVGKSAEAGYSSQLPLCACNIISFKTDFMLCKHLEVELYCQTRV